MTSPHRTMPVPYTPLYFGLASFVATVLDAVADGDPQDICLRADQLSAKGNELRGLVRECQAALSASDGSDTWSGSAAGSGRGLIDQLLHQLAQRADRAEEEAQSLRDIAELLQSAQDYYARQAALAEKIIASTLANSFPRPAAELMAVAMGMQLTVVMTRFQQALTAVGTDRLTPLWNDADQVAAQSPRYPSIT